jgi:hypothetical protein
MFELLKCECEDEEDDTEEMEERDEIEMVELSECEYIGFSEIISKCGVITVEGLKVSLLKAAGVDILLFP